MPGIREEYLGNGVIVCTDNDHATQTDAILLSSFAAPKRWDTACDLGCGCGIIPLLWLAGENPPKHVFGLELQPGAAALARLSGERSAAGERFTVVEGDLRDLPKSLRLGSFDLVTCNPPYKAVGTGIMSEKSSAQIARHETACTLDDVCAAAARLLRFGGRLCMSYLPERLADLLESMRAHRIEPKRLRFVQKNAESPPWLALAEGRLGSKPFLKVEAPLLLHENAAPAQYGNGKMQI